MDFDLVSVCVDCYVVGEWVLCFVEVCGLVSSVDEFLESYVNVEGVDIV